MRSLQALTLIAALALPQVVRAEGDEPPITTERWREPAPPLDLHWHLLALPEYAVEMMFSPIGVVVGAFERYRLDLRLYDALRNDAGTIVFIPKVKIAVGDGFGFGGSVAFKRLFGEEEKLDVGGLWRVDGDYELSARYRQRVAFMEGRQLDVRVQYEVDGNLPWYGIGNDTTEADERVVGETVLDSYVAIDVTGPGVPELTGVAELGFRRAQLATGSDPTTPSVAEGDTVALPPGFGETIGFPRFRLALAYDTRDNTGRPTRGVLVELEGRVTGDIDGQQQSAMHGEVVVSGFLPVLPDRRVFKLQLGFAVAAPTRDDHDIPFHELVTFGRKNRMRGYSKARFRDDIGWWTTLEYHWPVWEYINTGIALTPTLFLDVGRVGPNVEGMFEGNLRYSYGAGLRAAHDVLLFFILNVGMSEEGPQLDFSLGKDF